MSLRSTLPPLNAKALLLDLLRMVHPLSLPVSLLVEAGDVLGINENAVRVNITRLLGKEQLEQDERGYYRLGKQAAPFDEWLRAWQAGEARVKAWDGSWLLVSTATSLKTREAQAVFHMAYNFGFRQFASGSWIRPNNLNQSPQELARQLARLSHVNDFVMSESRSLFSPEGDINLQSLWNKQAIETSYKEVLVALEAGINDFTGKSVQDAFKDSYFIGAEVHHRLALDPLLPDKMLDTALRQKVIDRFAEYDACYRPAWLQFFKGYVLKSAKRHLPDQFAKAV